ncbi:MAG TPA: 2-haloalkanoic acid dehalogenase [Anaerolineae bacterium]|nr:2-haloalkanoic acid dehalogenase [Anaerolineae bacterium]
MPIHAAIFDFGNVLVKWDARNLYKRFFPDLQSVDSFLNQIHFLDWNAKQDAGRSFSEGVAELLKQFPHYADLIQAYDTNWQESLVETFDETVKIARQLKQDGLLLYILTNSSAEKFPIAKQKYPFLEELFNDCIVSGEVKLLKPDPAIYHLTLKRINLKAEECIFIDDSLPNIESACTLGFHAIHYQSPTQLKEEIEKLSIKV